MISLFKSRIVNAMNNIQLRHKLTFSFLLIIILLLTVYVVLIYNNFSKLLEDQIIHSTQKSFAQADALINEKLEKVRSVSEIIHFDQTFSDFLKVAPYDHDIYYKLRTVNDLHNFLSSLQTSDVISRINLYLNNKYTSVYNYTNIFPVSKEKLEELQSSLQKTNSEWYPQFNSDKGTDAHVVSYVKQLVSPDNYSNVIGYIHIDVPEILLAKILTNLNTLPNSVTYIQNSQGLKVSSTHWEFQGLMDISNILLNSSADGLKKGYWTSIEIDGNDMLTGVRSVPKTDWYIVTVIPYEEITKNSRNTLFIMFWIAAAIAFLAFFLANFIAYYNTKRIRNLVQKMNEAETGKLSIIHKSSSNDEVGHLINSYNIMISRISELLQEKFVLGQKVKEREIALLQSQINPHFLYNTLELINWVAEDDDYLGVVDITKSLSNYYKLTLAMGKPVVTLRHELNHTSEYVKIQNKRYAGSISLDITVDEDLMDIEIPKITLQPLVENSIEHGIRNTPSLAGEIKIGATVVDDMVYITVRDNGAGIKPEKLKALLSPKNNNDSGSFGIANIHERLKLYFGDEYGLEYTSVFSSFTEVTIKLPYKMVRS